MYPHQIERLTEAREREDLEALVATSAANIAYVTGFRRAGPAGEPLFAVSAARGSALVVPAAEVPGAVSAAPGVDHLLAYGALSAGLAQPAPPEAARAHEILASAAPGPAEALAAALDRLGVGPGPIAVDDSALSPAAWADLVARLKRARVLPGAAHFRTARRVKGPWEIECLEKALHLTEEALNAVIQALKAGVTEREAAAQIEAEAVRRGLAPLPTLVLMGERTALPCALPSDRAIRPGELVRFRAGAVWKGYHAVVERTATLGEPDRPQQALWEAVQASGDAAIDAIAPGATAAAVARVAVEAMQAAGLSRTGGERVGHGVGLELREPPELAEDDATSLEIGEVLQVEVGHWELGRAGAALAETVLVTRRGSYVMNRSLRGLIVLD